MPHSRTQRAETVYYVRTAVWELNSGLIFTAIWALYYSVMEMSLLQISAIFIVVTVSNLILEIPTGILADVYSRRLSVIIGGVFIGITWTIVGIWPTFAIALLASFIEAIGDTCVSGALEAWLTDEVGEDNVGDVLLRGRQFAAPALWVGVALSIALAALFDLRAPIILGGLLWFPLTIYLILTMPESHYKPVARLSNGPHTPMIALRASWETVKQGAVHLKGSPILQALFLVQLLGQAFFDAFYKYSRAHILLSFALPAITLPVLGLLKENVWFGLLEVAQGVLVLVGAEIVRRTVKLDAETAHARALLVLHVAMLGLLVGFVASGRFVLSMAIWVLLGSLQEIGGPIRASWLNQHIPSNIRATVLSMASQTGMVGVLGSSTTLGAIGDHYGVRSALGLAGLLLLPMIGVFGKQGQSETSQS